MDYTDITIETYNKIYKDYAARNNKPGKNIILLRKQFVQLLGNNKAHLLDLGCANGRDVKYFTNKGFKVTGIDLCEGFLDIAKRNNPETEFIKMDIRELSFPDSHFDGIWALASLLHISKKDLPKTIKGIYRVLKPNGIILSAVMEGDHDRLRTNPKLNWPERHFSDFKKNELKDLFTKQGFKFIRRELLPTSWGPLWLCYFFRNNNCYCKESKKRAK